MHHHCEIVIPPTTDIEGAVASVMKKFDENQQDDEEGYGYSKHAFWDFWVIGGRWAGHKLIAKYDETKIDEFYAWINAEKITVSGVQCGKPELSPASQIPKVDAKWNEMFPSAIPIKCPLFQHSNNQYGEGLGGTLPHDVARLSEVPERLTCSRVIFAGPRYESKSKGYSGPLEAKFMLAEDAWNGCNHMKVDWDRKLTTAVAKCRENFKNYKAEYVEKILPKDDWLAVTVDYHS
jgi:hypothetical protein